MTQRCFDGWGAFRPQDFFLEVNSVIPITETQAQAVVDGLITFLETKEGPLERIATEAVRAAIDAQGLPALWAYLKSKGIVN